MDDDALSDAESLFVPDHSRVILVNVGALPRLWRRLGIDSTFGGTEHEPTRIHAALIVVLLLHEAGHLVFHDPGSYQPPGRTDILELTLPADRIANAEIRADRFAVDQLLETDRRTVGGCMEPFYGFGPDAIVRDVRRGIRAASSVFDILQDPFGTFDGSPKPLIF